jgi:proteic killer suppression protein
VIRTFRHKRLAELWSTGVTKRIDQKLHRRILIRLDALEATSRPDDMRLPGFDFHALRGFRPPRYTVHVNGPWCVTFAFDNGDAQAVDLEQYH